MTTTTTNTLKIGAALLAASALLSGCLSEEAEGIAPSQPARTTVKMDFHHRPLPEIPLPNDVATRLDETSPTGRRINASLLAPTTMESRTRSLLAELDGWGVLQTISIPFTGPLDVGSIVAGHRDANYDLAHDVVYLINVDRDSKEFGRVHHLDVGNGNYPYTLEKIDNYWPNDPRGWTLSLLFDEEDEDINGNGVLDPGEDTDADGILDKPNYLPGMNPARDDLAGRADALMTFYESETNTLLVKPLVPLRQRTTYAVVVTRRLRDIDGNSVGSPFPYVNHTSQTEALKPLLEVLPSELDKSDIAFAITYTTESIEEPWKAVRDGLYGHGVQGHIGREFPPKVDGLLPLRDADAFPGMKNPHVMWSEHWTTAYKGVAATLLGQRDGSVSFEQLIDNNRYVDYHVIGHYESPQLFARGTEAGDVSTWLPFDAQSWPQDLETIPAPTRSETVYFHLTVPRPEVSARGEGKPAPVIFLGHGYGGNRFDVVSFGGYFAKFGYATLAIDNVSHGISIPPDDKAQAEEILSGFGLSGFSEAVFTDRAYDQNNDGTVDSGADFWSAYMFHTRDVVRQTALDYMQAVRVLRAFDGQNTWEFDVDGDGDNELAGDFDGDGVVDIGGDATIGMVGGSLGGMMTVVMGALEPEITVTVPIIAGGAMSDIGIRSQQGGVPEAFILRSMGPIFLGTLGERVRNDEGEVVWQAAAEGELKIETIIPDLNDKQIIHLATVKDVWRGDTMVVENLESGERDCGYVSAEGTVRTALPTNLHAAMRILFYRGNALVLGSEECEVRDGMEPNVVVDRFREEVEFQTLVFKKGEPLVALAEGLGLKRATPGFRRLQNIAQMVLDPADPATLAPHIMKEPMTYPGTGQTTGAHALMLPSIGDMSVPVSTGIAIGRAAGLVNYLEDHPVHGKSENQVLIDTYTGEAVNTLKRFVNPEGVGVHMDVDNFSGGTDLWGDTVPRLDPPLRSGLDRPDPLGGQSMISFTYGEPTGRHGFPSPGEMIDKARRTCVDECGVADCDCVNATTFDVGNFYLNMAGHYLKTRGMEIRSDACLAHNDCEDFPPLPEVRYNPDDPDAVPPIRPECVFPDPIIGGEAPFDELAGAPARCGMEPYAWSTDESLGDVTGFGTNDSFPAELLSAIVTMEGIELPRELEYDAEIVQFSYLTQDRGELVEATAVAALPLEVPDDKALDVLLFLGEPEGFNSTCSTANLFVQRGIMALLASFGQVVVAPDYLGLEGFGEPRDRLRPLFVAEAAVIPALDAVRAASKLQAGEASLCITPNVIVLGAGEGGQAAMFAERFAPAYAPELQIAGTIAVAPPTDLTRHVETSLAAGITDFSHRTADFFVLASEWYGVEDQLGEIFLDGKAEAIRASLGAGCDVKSLRDSASLEEVFQPSFLEAVRAGELDTLEPWGCMVAENSVTTATLPRLTERAPHVGGLMALAEEDSLIDPVIERASFEAMCANGVPMDYLECAEVNHGDGLLGALPLILTFVDDRFAEEPFSGACEVQAPAECTLQ